MKLVLFGATGHIGHAILEEALARGYDVTAVVRDASRLKQQHDRLHVVVGTVEQPTTWLAHAKHANAVIASISARRDGNSDTLPDAARTLLDTLNEGTQPKRLLWVGGAGSLEVAPGVLVIDDPHFPEAWKAEAQSMVRALEVFRASKADVDWTFVSPPALIEDGSRTGKYRVGGDQLLVDANGVSHISVPDYAAALLDQLDKKEAFKRRITVAY
ncbi:NAD(P)-dependent oxidoreductase [Dyella caseinilytica]|uniref:NAD(P)H-binding protein n=1 Tax=Dyella caseinilytica TaxID=1849581 RepID=A0ABX7GTD8_9GAMM|nr:NAD(P)H-binding protein [Dyella caseinilytica]QRN52535.1 NAD(P)H-binding protein [Dyella caseinilytica]GGA06828.1 NAD-dependent dehydratase [Dyella caseinilytica]